MEAKAELSREVDTEHEEEKIIEWGEASQETKGSSSGPFPEGGSRSWS